MKNNTKCGLKEIVLRTALAAILSVTGCSPPSPPQSNLDRVINNLQTCSKDDLARNYMIEDLKEYHKKTKLSQINQHYKDFLELSNEQRLEKLSEMSKEGFSGCNVYDNIKNLTDKEALAFYKWELSFYSPF